MDAEQALSVLRDIHQPVAPLWSSPGLWLSVLGVAALIAWWAHSRVRFDPRRAALLELQQLRGRAQTVTSHELAADLNLLLRRFVYFSGDQSAARLYGEDWLTYLEHYHEESRFTTGTGTALAWAPYVNSDPPLDIDALFAQAKRWIEQARGFAEARNDATAGERAGNVFKSLGRALRARRYLRRIHRACAANDLRTLRCELMNWYRVVTDANCAGLEDIAARYRDQDLANTLAMLNADLYGVGPVDIDGPKLWRSLNPVLTPASAFGMTRGLPGLYER